MSAALLAVALAASAAAVVLVAVAAYRVALTVAAPHTGPATDGECPTTPASLDPSRRGH